MIVVGQSLCDLEKKLPGESPTALYGSGSFLKIQFSRALGKTDSKALKCSLPLYMDSHCVWLVPRLNIHII